MSATTPTLTRDGEPSARSARPFLPEYARSLPLTCGGQAFETADQAAGSAAAMLIDGERLSRLWRYVFAQLLDDMDSALMGQAARA
jgi:hypothetical protein